MAREADLEKALTKWAKAVGILTYKFVSPGKSGVPDRIFIYNKKIVFLELKAFGEHPTALQSHEIKTLRTYGMTAAWSDNLISAKEYLTKQLNVQTAD